MFRATMCPSSGADDWLVFSPRVGSAVTMSGVIQICLSVWVDMFCVCLVYGKSSVIGLCVVIMWGVVGGGFIVVCRCGSVCKQIKVHTCGYSKVVKTGW